MSPKIRVHARTSATIVLTLCMLAVPAISQSPGAPPVEKAPDVESLIAALGAPGFAEREAAEELLRENFAGARELLLRARSSSDPEIRWRATRILDDLDAPTPQTERPQTETPVTETPQTETPQTETPQTKTRRQQPQRGGKDAQSRAWQDLDAQLRGLLGEGAKDRPLPLRPGELAERDRPEGLRQWESEDGNARGWTFQSNGEIPEELWESLNQDMGRLRGWGSRLQRELDETQRGMRQGLGEDPWAMLQDDNLDAMVQQMLQSLDTQIAELDLESLLGEDMKGFESLLRPETTPRGRSARPRGELARPQQGLARPQQGAQTGARLGVLIAPPSEVLRAQLGFDGGVVVTEVLAGTPARRAGLRTHDVILSVGGEAIQDGAGLRARLDQLGAGGEGDLEILRAGTRRRLAFDLR